MGAAEHGPAPLTGLLVWWVPGEGGPAGELLLLEPCRTELSSVEIAGVE